MKDTQKVLSVQDISCLGKCSLTVALPIISAMGVEAADPEIGMLYRDLSQFKDTDIPKAIDIIQAIARQINVELEARRRAGGRSGKLDFRRTIRKGLETGGSFYRLHYKKKRSRKKHLVLLCDVSGSMMQFSEFVLRFMKSISDTADSSQIFLFSEDVRKVDPFALQNMDGFASYVRNSGCFGRGTDLGKALDTLNSIRPSVLGPSTIFIVISDVKTIDLAHAERALMRSMTKAGKVVFLNPIPEKKWSYLKGCQAISALTTMVSCSTLNELARACRKLLGS